LLTYYLTFYILWLRFVNCIIKDYYITLAWCSDLFTCDAGR